MKTVYIITEAGHTQSWGAWRALGPSHDSEHQAMNAASFDSIHFFSVQAWKKTKETQRTIPLVNSANGATYTSLLVLELKSDA